MNHVNKNDVLVHNVVKIDNKSCYSSHVSFKVRDCNLSHLRLDLSIPQILAKHKKHFMEVCKKGEVLTVNLFISEQNMCKLAAKLAIENHKHDIK